MKQIAFVALFLFAGSIEAQVGPRARPDTMIGRNPHAAPVRLFGSLGGSFVGFFGGAYAGYNLLPHTPNGDDPGLRELVQGALVGATVGAAIGASAPNLRSICKFSTRFKRSIIGAGIAATVGFIFVGGANESSIIAVPASAMGGSLAALGRCWKSFL